MKTDFELVRIYPSGAISTISHFSKPAPAKAEARARHQNEKTKDFAVNKITTEEIYRVLPEF